MRYYGSINLWIDAADEEQANEIQGSCRDVVLEVPGVNDAFADDAPEIDEMDAADAAGEL